MVKRFGPDGALEANFVRRVQHEARPSASNDVLLSQLDLCILKLVQYLQNYIKPRPM